MKPTVGRIVHYTNLGDADGKYPPEQQAAIVTKVKPREDDATDGEGEYDVSLHIFYETGDFYMKNVPFSETYKRGCWTWPPREGESRDLIHSFTVNGVGHSTNANILSYAEVVALAKHKGHPTVVWRDRRRGGTLAPGEDLRLFEEDLVISVAHTDNA